MYGSRYGAPPQFGSQYGSQYGSAYNGAASTRPDYAAYGPFNGPAGGYGNASMGSFGSASAQVSRPGLAGAPPAAPVGAPSNFSAPADPNTTTSGGLPRSSSYNPSPFGGSAIGFPGVGGPPPYAVQQAAPPSFTSTVQASEPPSPSPVPSFSQVGGLRRSASFNGSIMSNASFAQSNVVLDDSTFKAHSSFNKSSAAFMPGNRMEHSSSYTDPKRPGTFQGPTTMKSTPGPGAYNPPTSSFLKSPLSSSPKSLRKK